MNYKAYELLPIELILKLQEYVDGIYVYIPKKNENKKHWGENTKTKTLLKIRNDEIFKLYNDGENIKNLAEKYFLTESSIRKIIKKYKNQSF